MFWTKRVGLLESIHQADCHSRGAVLFPLSLALCAGIYWPITPLIYQGAALILGLADGLAGIIGQSLGRRSYDITGRKTIEGSLSFFVISWAILMGLLLYNQSPISGLLMFQAALASLLLTVLEGVTGYGWDNLPVPLLAGLMIYILII